MVLLTVFFHPAQAAELGANRQFVLSERSQLDVGAGCLGVETDEGYRYGFPWAGILYFTVQKIRPQDA